MHKWVETMMIHPLIAVIFVWKEDSVYAVDLYFGR